MKSILHFLICLVASAGLSHALPFGFWKAAGGGGGGGGTTYTYLVNQGFEGTGYDNSESWTEFGTGTMDEDYTGVVLDGSQSLRCVTSAATFKNIKTFTASDSVTLCFQFRFIDAPDDYIYWAGFFDNTESPLGVIKLISGNFAIDHGSGQVSGTMTYATGTNYYAWLEYAKSTGSNGTLRLYVSTTTTKPGSPDAVVTTGSSTAQAASIILGPSNGGSTGEIIYDHIRVVAGTSVTDWAL